MTQNLANLSKEKLKEFLNSFDHVLCDCDGVIYILYKPIEGAIDALETLKSLGKYVGYVTNNTTVSLEKMTSRLCECGVNATIEDVIYPTSALIAYLRSINFNKKIYLIGLSDMRKAFIDAGFQLTDYEPTGDLPENFEAFISRVQDDPDVGAVILDFDPNMNFIRLQRAVTYCKRPDVLFMTGGADMVLPFGHDLYMIGHGHFNKIVEYMVGRESMKFGKPGKYMNKYVDERLKLDPRRTLFIGDSFHDMVFANDGGYQKLMVLSGVTKLEDIEKCEDPDLLPDFYINSLGEFNKAIENLN